MLSKMNIIAVTVVVLLAIGSAGLATELDGTIKLGGIIVDETGDLSVMQETYNIYDGFSVTHIDLGGNFNPKTHFRLDLNDINLDNRRGSFDFWVPGRFKLFSRYDQHRQVFDPNRVVNSKRKDWQVGAWFTPVEWAKISADYGYQTRTGQRLGYPMGTESHLGHDYDYVLQRGYVEGEFRKDSRSVAVSYDFSDYTDDLRDMNNRFGYVVAARLRSPCYFSDKITHLLRGAVGKREVTNANTDFKLANFQYVGVAGPVRDFQLRYNFYVGRIDDSSTQMKTDNIRNIFDLTYYYRYGRLFGGYGYEINDDDRSLTSYHTYKLGGSFRGVEALSGKLEYASRAKKDEEKLTLLKDMDAQKLLAKLQYEWNNDLVLGVVYRNREREFPDIDVEAEGKNINCYGRYTYVDWGTIGAEYTYSEDEYQNLAGGFETKNHIVTARAYSEWVRNLRLGGAVTYLDVGGDLDIEKSIFSVEAAYRFLEDFVVELKYNVYNYDDYILWDRYYTANVVWINVAYDFDYGKE